MKVSILNFGCVVQIFEIFSYSLLSIRCMPYENVLHLMLSNDFYIKVFIRSHYIVVFKLSTIFFFFNETHISTKITESEVREVLKNFK